MYSWFSLAKRYLIKINVTSWIMKPRPNTWWILATGDIAWRREMFQKYRLRRIYASTVHHRFWLESYERLDIRSAKYKHKYSLDLDRFKTKCNVDDVFNEHSVYIQYNNYWLHKRVTWEIVTPRKPISTSASSRSALVISDLEYTFASTLDMIF